MSPQATPSLLHATLAAARAAALAHVAAIDATLRAIDGAVEEPRRPAGCQHAARIATPRMGAPDAWACPTCGASWPAMDATTRDTTAVGVAASPQEGG